uniref:Uncharacterized protein n=1 Tax=Glossina pallidipes TaxID=7398 RepID=A0A1A9ZXQ8_GLOPL
MDSACGLEVLSSGVLRIDIKLVLLDMKYSVEHSPSLKKAPCGGGNRESKAEMKRLSMVTKNAKPLKRCVPPKVKPDTYHACQYMSKSRLIVLVQTQLVGYPDNTNRSNLKDSQADW